MKLMLWRGGNLPLFLIECRWRHRNKTHQMKNDISEVRGEYNTLVKAAKKHTIYSKYNDHKTILATRHVDWSENEEQYAATEPRVHIWDDRVVEFYSDLARVLVNTQFITFWAKWG